MRGQSGGVGSELGDLEWDRGSALQLLLQLVIAPRIVRAVPVTRGAKRRQRFFPCLGVDLRETGGAVLKSERLRSDAGRLVPGVMRARATIATSPAAKPTVSAAAEPLPGACPRVASFARKSSSRRSR